ncbi:VOC family protein [Brevundimonas sp. VNH65]|uniref:VOC family protein n=1 Tax=Brevundimonas sp. VNH65 TaxID=3400917 RepID=UPI003C0597F0
MNLNQITVEVSDIGRSRDFYQRLGLELIVSADHYARFQCPTPEGQGATFSIHLSDTVRPNGTGVYFECDDLDARVERLKAAGIAFDHDPVDRRWLWREAWLRDPDGNRCCLYFAGRNRADPPWRLTPTT